MKKRLLVLFKILTWIFLVLPQNVLFAQTEPPVFSKESGFYTEGFALTLSHPEPGATIIYSLDGSAPSPEHLPGVSYTYKNQYPQNPGQESGPLYTHTYRSAVYSGPIDISDRSLLPNKLANISSTWHFSPDYFPSEPIKKASVVRAIAVVDGVSSKIVNHTYFVSATHAFSSSLPIVSINLSEDGLFDYHSGIYVAGRDFDNWRINDPQGITNGHVPANYRRRGMATEKAASFQYFIDRKEVLNQNIGLRLHGAFSRHVQNKTFRLYARSEYDSQNSFDYPFFGPGNSGSFKRLLLRNSGNDAGNYWIGGALTWTYSPAVYFRDAFIHKMVEHLRFDTQDYIPVITYVNGEYWGILNLRERYDRHYLERMYGILKSEADYLTGNASAVIGNNDHYLMTLNYISNNNLAIHENYEHVKTLIDTASFMDYQIAQIYARNTDWPGNNIDYFRKRTNGFSPEAPYGQDGRWRWMMFDTDHGFGWSGGTSYTHNTLNGASNDASWSKVILFKLLENSTFRISFINRYADLLNTAFLPGRLVSMIDEMADRIATEIPIHRARWNTLQNWDEHVALMREFAQRRPEHARNHIRSRFNLGNPITVVVNLSDSEQGYIHLNTIEISDKTPGISSNPYPWSGIYFRNIPLTVTAKPKPGYRFSHWSGQRSSSEPSIIVTPTGNVSFQANFVPVNEQNLNLIHFWLFDNKLENDAPLHTIRSTYTIHGDPASIHFLSSFGEDYPFQPGDKNWRKGSLERRNAPTSLNYYPMANNNIAYDDTDMRGIQVKQPFLGHGYENTLIMNYSTENYQDIVVSFAAKDEGAAGKLIFDYFNTNTGKWIHTGIVATDTELTDLYKKFEVNLAHVPTASNNADFALRIRFAGPDMTKDYGNRVTFNNFAVRGTDYIPSGYQAERQNYSPMVTVYPNPFSDHIGIHCSPVLKGSLFGIYNLNGQLVHHGVLNGSTNTVNLSHILPGVYVLKIDNENPHVIKIVRQ